MRVLFWVPLEHQDHYSRDKLSLAADHLSLGKNKEPLVWSISPMLSWRRLRSFCLTNWNRQGPSCRHRFVSLKICLWCKSNMFGDDSGLTDCRRIIHRHQGTCLSVRLADRWHHFSPSMLKKVNLLLFSDPSGHECILQFIFSGMRSI